jgi:hypothetical protein
VLINFVIFHAQSIQRAKPSHAHVCIRHGVTDLDAAIVSIKGLMSRLHLEVLLLHLVATQERNESLKKYATCTVHTSIKLQP